MKYKSGFIILLSLCLIITLLNIARAADYQSPMSLYKENYFVLGNNDDQVKFQFSAKYNILYPANIGLFFGYTQISWWKVYGGSDRFSSNYQPEAFYQLESKNNPFDLDMGYIDYIQISPFMHSSTGVEGDDHRSINIFYGQIQASIGDVYNFGTNLKFYGYYTRYEKNEDINDYRHNYEADLFFKYKSKTNWYIDKYEAHFKCSGNPFGKGYYILEGVFQIFTSRIQPKIFMQFNSGYGIDMVYYNKKETEVRAGLIF